MDEDEMLVRMNKLVFVGNLTDSLTAFTERHQGFMLGSDSTFQKGEIYTCWRRERGTVVMQLLPFTVGIESLLYVSLIFSIGF